MIEIFGADSKPIKDIPGSCPQKNTPWTKSVLSFILAWKSTLHAESAAGYLSAKLSDFLNNQGQRCSVNAERNGQVPLLPEDLQQLFKLRPKALIVRLIHIPAGTAASQRHNVFLPAIPALAENGLQLIV